MAKQRKKPGPPPIPPPSTDKELNQLFNYCLLGATNDDLATYYSVTRTTIDKWIKTNEVFAGTLKRGRDEADAKVTKSLYQRATGYSHKAVKIFYDSKTGETIEHEYIERFPPSEVAAFFWLKNRQRALWRDRPEGAGAEAPANVNLNVNWAPAPGCIPLKPISEIEDEAAKDEEQLNKPADANNDQKGT